jgi:hypothetical protein
VAGGPSRRGQAERHRAKCVERRRHVGRLHEAEPREVMDENRRHAVDTTDYLAHLTLLADDRIGMSAWRGKLFITPRARG